MNCLLVRLSGEINIKSEFVRRQCEHKLINNLKQALQENKIWLENYKNIGGKLILLLKENDFKKATQVLQKVFGISSICPGQYYEFESKEQLIESVVQFAEKNLEKKKSFKLEMKKSNNHAFESLKIKREAGLRIEKELKLKVDIIKPDQVLNIDLRKDFFVLFSKVFPGLHGMPVSTSGNVIAILSGKKNELLASLLILSRGCRIYFIYKKEKSKALRQFNKLKPFMYGFNPRLESFKQASELIKQKNIKGLIDSSEKIHSKKVSPIGLKENLLILQPLAFLTKDLKQNYSKMLVIKCQGT